MFKVEDYKKLNAIWDGTLSNGTEVCGACGACCHNTDKLLFAGEYDFLVKTTGQRNIDWKSVGCLCMQVNKSKRISIKPVICKIFPLQITVALEGQVKFDAEIPVTEYSTNCKKLIVSDENKVKIQAYLDFLFSDIHNRLLYILIFNIPDTIDKEREYLKTLGKKMSYHELYERAVYNCVGLSLKEISTHFVFKEK